MSPFPLNLVDLLGHWEAYAVSILLGFAFGFVLEMAGFGNSTRLAGQFYLKDMTVLKVMFTGIVVAMLLIFAASALGLLDYNLLWVNPTFLIPGIVGGLIMGVGFIIGGFCPGTSLVAAATLKLDGIFFALGVLFGIFLFGESVGSFEGFWNSTDMGRYTLMDFFGVDTGVVVLGVVIMALGAFLAAEYSEQIFGGHARKLAPKWRYSAAAAGLALGVAVLMIGQPTREDRWEAMAAEKETELEARTLQIHPGELLDTMHNDRLNLIMLDVRSESDYNRFHILDAQHVPLSQLDQHIEGFLEEPANTVFVVMSNDEIAATEAWKLLAAESVPNIYILEGGVNNWIWTFGEEEFITQHQISTPAPDALAFQFETALGARYPFANPHAGEYALEYVSKIKLESKRGGSSGGCG